MTFYKRWRFGNSRKADDGLVTDYVIAYVAENGSKIDVVYGIFSKHYEVCGKQFRSLKGAMNACA